MKINNIKYQNFIKKVFPPIKFLTYNLLNQSIFKELTNKKSKKFQNILAFSLIELSIVLIIIGLLVSGIVGGASLIESAKMHAFYNSFNQYKQAVYAFYTRYDRLPGDFNLDGQIGYRSGESIKAKYFKFPYDGTDEKNKHYLPNALTAPFIELYQEKLIDLELAGNENTNSNVSTMKGISDVFCYFETIDKDYTTQHYFYNIPIGTIIFQCNIEDSPNYKILGPKFAYKFDKKYDDGIYNSGNFRAVCCTGKDYILAINNKCTCLYYSYIMFK